MKRSPSTTDRIEVLRQKGQIWSHLRKKWLSETPEEAVRQEYLCVLVNEYGFKLEQIDEEATLPGKRGNKHARADFVIWRSVEDRRNDDTALIVVERKADNVEIDQHACDQGANYANNERVKFVVAHNRRQLIEVYDAVRSRIPKKVFLARRYPKQEEAEQLTRANNRLGTLKQLVESDLGLELVDLGSEEGGIHQHSRAHVSGDRRRRNIHRGSHGTSTKCDD